MLKYLITGYLIIQSLFTYAGEYKLFPKVVRHKYGVLIGLERGKYSFVELGGEFQYKKLKFKNAPTISLNGLAQYNFTHNVLTYQLGSWYRIGRANLTYGGNFHYLTNFDHHKFGFSPSVGYKLIGFHVQTGYKFTTKAEFEEHNNFFISIRYFISQNRKTKIIRKNKKKEN